MAESLAAPNALTMINKWRHLLMRGEKKQIDQFLEEIERRFDVLGWKRDSVFEGKLNSEPDHLHRFHCWNSGPDNAPHILLCLNRTTDRS